jgi:hypothetical protein
MMTDKSMAMGFYQKSEATNFFAEPKGILKPLFKP